MQTVDDYSPITTRVSTLERDVAGLRSDMHNVLGGLDHVRTALEGLGTKPSQGTDWVLMAAWSAIVMGIISSLGTLALLPVYDHQERMNHHTSSRAGDHERIRAIEREVFNESRTE